MVKIGKTDKTEVDPVAVHCVRCAHAWTMKDGDTLRCPECDGTFFSTTPQVRV